jgi:molybdenum cofactor guanylyltransferase
MPWTAAIIAGGAASRFGNRDKATLIVGSRSILDRQLCAIRPLTDRIIAIANRPAAFAAAGLPVFEDLVPGAGALGGIYTALIAATTDRVVAIACDMPFLTTAFLGRLVELGAQADLTVPRPADGYQPLCACYSRACIEPLRQRIAARALRLQDLVADVRTTEIDARELATYDPDGTLFFNVNTPEDHAVAHRLRAARRSQT